MGARATPKEKAIPKISAPQKGKPKGHLFQECIALRVLSNIK